MQIYTVDLATEWQSRRWRRLLNLIDHLPRTSQTYQAMADDEYFATQVLDLEIPRSQSLRLITEWSPEVEMLTNVYDRLGEQITVALAAAGVKKPVRAKPAPRPKTAMDRVRARRRAQDAGLLKSKLLPGRAEPQPTAPESDNA